MSWEQVHHLVPYLFEQEFFKNEQGLALVCKSWRALFHKQYVARAEPDPRTIRANVHGTQATIGLYFKKEPIELYQELGRPRCWMHHTSGCVACELIANFTPEAVFPLEVERERVLLEPNQRKSVKICINRAPNFHTDVWQIHSARCITSSPTTSRNLVQNVCIFSRANVYHPIWECDAISNEAACCALGLSDSRGLLTPILLPCYFGQALYSFGYHHLQIELESPVAQAVEVQLEYTPFMLPRLSKCLGDLRFFYRMVHLRPERFSVCGNNVDVTIPLNESTNIGFILCMPQGVGFESASLRILQNQWTDPLEVILRRWTATECAWAWSQSGAAPQSTSDVAYFYLPLSTLLFRELSRFSRIMPRASGSLVIHGINSANRVCKLTLLRLSLNMHDHCLWNPIFRD